VIPLSGASRAARPAGARVRGHSGLVLITVAGVRALRFDDGTPVTAASAVAPLGDGWLVAQDDSTVGAWLRAGSVAAVRLLPPVEGLDRFSEEAGTKRLKPDLEVACPAEVDGEPAVLLLGSGATDRRTRGVLVRLDGGVRPGSVDVPLAALVDAVLGRAGAADVPVARPRVYDLGEVAGVGLAVTDAIALPDGRLLLSAAAEDTPNAVDDGPVVASALALVDGDDVLEVGRVPEVDGRVAKVEGLALRGVADGVVHLLAVVDDDDATRPATALELRVALG